MTHLPGSGPLASAREVKKKLFVARRATVAGFSQVSRDIGEISW